MADRLPSKRIIFNADDIGFSRPVTDSIIQCHVSGIITSATLMANMPAAEYAAEQSARHPELGIGVHVNLTEGSPVAGADRVHALVGDDGLFPGNAAQSKRLWRAPELYEPIRTEIAAQIQRVVDLGVTPTHCDSHHGIYKMPVVRQALIEVLHQFGIERARTTLSWHRLVPGQRSPRTVLAWTGKMAARGPTVAMHAWSHHRLRAQGIRTPAWKAARHLSMPTPSSPVDQLLATIAAAPRGKTSEILLHPGSYEPDEQPTEKRIRMWADDLDACLDPRVTAFLEEHRIERISFRDL